MYIFVRETKTKTKSQIADKNNTASELRADGPGFLGPRPFVGFHSRPEARPRPYKIFPKAVGPARPGPTIEIKNND